MRANYRETSGLCWLCASVAIERPEAPLAIGIVQPAPSGLPSRVRQSIISRSLAELSGEAVTVNSCDGQGVQTSPGVRDLSVAPRRFAQIGPAELTRLSSATCRMEHLRRRQNDERLISAGEGIAPPLPFLPRRPADADAACSPHSTQLAQRLRDQLTEGNSLGSSRVRIGDIEDEATPFDHESKRSSRKIQPACYFVLASIVFWAFCASGVLGRRTVTLSKDASILSASTPSGTLNARLKEPISGAYRADGRGAYGGELAKHAK
jgi:hypothetical protein